MEISLTRIAKYANVEAHLSATKQPDLGESKPGGLMRFANLSSDIDLLLVVFNFCFGLQKSFGELRE